MSLSPQPKPCERSQISGNGSSASNRITASSRYGWRASRPQSEMMRSSRPRFRNQIRSLSSSRVAESPSQPCRE
eukprot:scaffold121930_cov30-Tisochrysis_lutea.AAC.2